MGKSSYTQGNKGGGASGLSIPVGVVLTLGGSLIVADNDNSRILFWPDISLLSTPGQPASAVFGQPDLTSSIGNNGGVSQTSIGPGVGNASLVSTGPMALCLDRSGYMWIADSSNNRITVNKNPFE